MREQRIMWYQRCMRKGFLAVLFLAMVFSFRAAEAKTSSGDSNSQKEVYAGDSFQVTDVLKSIKTTENISFQISAEDKKSQAVSVSDDGTVTAREEGKVTVLVLDKKTKIVLERIVVVVKEAEKIEAGYGSAVKFAAWDDYDAADYDCILKGNSLEPDKKTNRYVVTGLTKTDVYFQKKGSDRRFHVASVNVKKPAFSSKNIIRAVGAPSFVPAVTNFSMEFSATSTTRMVFRIDDVSKAFANGWNISTRAAGTTKLNAVFYAANGDQTVFSSVLTVTNPTFAVGTIAIAKGQTKQAAVTGTVPGSVMTASKASVSDYAYFTTNSMIYGAKEGTTSLILDVDGKNLSINVVVTDPKVDELTNSVIKGKKRQIVVTGIDETYSTVTYQSSDKKIATVSAAGIVKGKKAGNVNIIVNADGRIITIAMLVEPKVASNAGIKAAKKAIAISKRKTKYSQVRRMQKNFYDCSSLISRVYRVYKVYFGVATGWSPTAASIGQWCTNNNKVIATKGISSTKLKPGDLIFYSFKKNGRYKNISHIEIYVGEGKNVSASSSKNRVIQYGYRKSSVVMIARPTK